MRDGISTLTSSEGAVPRDSEERESILLQLSDALREAGDLDSLSRTATRMVAAHFRADRCWIARFSRDLGKVWLEHETRRPDLSSVEGEHDLADFLDTMWESRAKTLAIEDVQADPQDKARFAALRIGAFMAATVHNGDGNHGWDICVTTVGPRRWSTEDQSLLEEIAERTWAASERARAQTALRQSEERLQRVLQTDAVGILFFRPDGTLISANHVFRAMTGWTEAEIESGTLHWRDLTPAEWLPDAEAQMALFAQTGRLGPYEKDICIRTARAPGCCLRAAILATARSSNSPSTSLSANERQNGRLC